MLSRHQFVVGNGNKVFIVPFDDLSYDSLLPFEITLELPFMGILGRSAANEHTLRYRSINELMNVYSFTRWTFFREPQGKATELSTLREATND